MRRLKTHPSKKMCHYFGVGTDDLIKVSFQRHEPRESVMFTLIDRKKKKLKSIVSRSPKGKLFTFTKNPSVISPYSWWIIINLLGWKIIITCD